MDNHAPEVPEAVKKEADDLAGDILKILDKNGLAQKTDKETLKSLMVDFSIYIVNRDHRVWRHAYKVGRSTALRTTKIGAN